MCSTAVDLDDALAGVAIAVDELNNIHTNTLTTPRRLSALAALSTVTRRLAAVENELIAGLQRDATPAELGDTLASALARTALTTKTEANARIRDAEDTATRTALTGESLPPRFPATASAVAAGRLDRAHIREIHRFFTKIPANIPLDERHKAETFLAEIATRLRPDELRKAADQMLAFMGHEDDYTDADRTRRRGFIWSRPDADGMSKGILWATPALRAELDAVLAAWAAPGKCNPDDETPCLDGEPDAQIAERDTRTPAQRNHDAVTAMARALLASGTLGSHNGLPVTVIVSTTLQELQNAAGNGYTGGGTKLPMADIIRMAAHANHYLLIYDGATEIPLWLGRTRRTASPGQRIVMHHKDRGCSFPGCDMPGYLSQAHHATRDWANGGLTNIDELTFCCPAHHRLVTLHGWTTRKNIFGQTEWIPPPQLQLQLPSGINHYHHPERYLEPQRRDTGRDRSPSSPIRRE